MVRFLHAADLHLGMRITRFSPERIDKVREARFIALERLRAEARKPEKGYQFLIIAGDLFDDVRVKRTIADRAHNLLSSFPIPVVVISGNHDPFEPGSVWDCAPWNGPAANIHVLREPVPFTGIPGVTIYPCPVFRKTSTEDPTGWIADQPRTGEEGFRIGIAHGSVMDRPNLPLNDHPISPTAPLDLGLDYLALGHWHKTNIYRSVKSRMAYAGVHEPMRFHGETNSSGWKPYSTGGDREEFLDDGRGTALAVEIRGPGEEPQIEEVDVGHLTWTARTETVTSAEDLDRIFVDVVEAPQFESTLLRIRVQGALPIESMHRVDELREALGRYVVGELDDSSLLVEPTADEVREIVGCGVLRSVVEKLNESLAGANGDPGGRAVAERALRLLYQMARSVREQA